MTDPAPRDPGFPHFRPDRFPAPWAASGRPGSACDAVLGPLLVRAGEQLMARFGAGAAHRKADGSPVTEADHASQAVLVAGLRAAFPEDGVVAEEDLSIPGGPRTWFVDPLDGTSAFAEGLAHWGPTVARIEGGTVQCGALWLPRLGEYYFAEAGLGASRNGEPLPRLDDTPMRRSAVLYGPSRLHAGASLVWPGKVRCLGSIAAHLALVAAGAGAAALIGPGWKRWDTALGLALIEAVGGRALLADGQALDLREHEGLAFVAGRSEAVEWLLQPGHLVPLRTRRGDDEGTRNTAG